MLSATRSSSLTWAAVRRCSRQVAPYLRFNVVEFAAHLNEEHPARNPYDRRG